MKKLSSLLALVILGSSAAEAYIFSNGIIELNIDDDTGYFNSISNLVHQRDYKVQDSGSWPFGLEVTDPASGKVIPIEISATNVVRQKVEIKGVTITDGRILRMSYKDLLTTEGRRSGVALTVQITLMDGADYFLVKAHIENKGWYDLSNFYSGSGGLIAADTRAEETLIVPGWDYGTVYDNPYATFTSRATYGYPIFGNRTSLTAGWIDLHGPQGGIGMGYLNRQGITMLFNVQREETSLNVNWQLFNLNDPSNAWSTERGVYPLKPGKSFTTDQWIIAPHGGDWHRMADIYRLEYEEAFAGTFLNEENNNPIVEKIDIGASFQNADIRSPALTINFNEIPGAVNHFVETYGVGYDNIVFAIMGSPENYPHYLPDYLNINSESGGYVGLQNALADLRNLGMESAILYGHPYFNHPDATNYVAEADMGISVNGSELFGNVACTEEAGWQNIWRTVLAPGYRDLGAAGVYWDQGPTQYYICPKGDHPEHGDDSVLKLTSHTKGILQMQDSFDEQYGVIDRNAISWVEVSSDLIGRTMDIWTTSEGNYNTGGVQKKEIVRYAIPYHYCVDVTPVTVEGLNYTWANGFIILPTPTFPTEIKNCVAARRELRAHDFGFPCGFKDTVGLTVENTNLVARAYRSDKGISVLYFAKEALQGAITVSPADLGFPQGKDVALSLTLAKNEIGYELISLERMMANVTELASTAPSGKSD